MGNSQTQPCERRTKSLSFCCSPSADLSNYIEASFEVIQADEFADVSLSSFHNVSIPAAKSLENRRPFRLESAFLHARPLDNEVTLASTPNFKLRSKLKSGSSSFASVTTDHTDPVQFRNPRDSYRFGK